MIAQIDTFVNQFLTAASSQGLSMAMLVLAIWWLNRQNQRNEDRREKERAVRDLELRERIAILEKAVSICDEDRREMRKEIVALATASTPGKAG